MTIQGIGKSSEIKGIDLFKNKNLFFISTEKISDTLIKQNANVSNIRITKKFPDTLEIVVDTFSPIAKMETNAGYLYLAENGRILNKIKQKPTDSYPLIHYYQKIIHDRFSTGELLNYTDILTALFFIKALNDLNIKTDSIDILGADMILLNISERQILIANNKDKEYQRLVLFELIRQFKIEGKEFRKIDLRFDKPIVTF